MSTTYILLSRHNHNQGYKLTETLRFQRDKHLVNIRQQRESVSLLDSENRRRGPSVIHNAVISKPASRKPALVLLLLVVLLLLLPLMLPLPLLLLLLPVMFPLPPLLLLLYVTIPKYASLLSISVHLCPSRYSCVPVFSRVCLVLKEHSVVVVR